MRAVFWIVAICAIGAGLVAAARYNTGYALLVSPPYRIELSLNLVAVLLIAAFVVAYLAVRMISGTMRLPARVQAYRSLRRREKGHARLAEAVHEFFGGRYAAAEKAASEAGSLGEQGGLTAVLAARAAHQLRAYERRDAYLDEAARLLPAADAARATTEAELLLDQRRYQEALDALKALPRRHTAALRLELRAQQALRNWEAVLGLIAELQKRDVFDAEQARQVRVRAQAEHLKRRALDERALTEAWNRISARERKEPRIAAAAAQAFIAFGSCARAQDVIEQSLAENWDSALVLLYAECDEGDVLRRIERAERWLEREPRDPALLLALGRLCARQALWGKAQSYLEASIAVEPTWSAHYALARLQEKLGNAEAAQHHARASLEAAIAQLRQVTGGRRRTPL
jgi:HemY protein